MFRIAESFNQPLNKWNVSKVNNMTDMFLGATSFNQHLDWY
jgi:surface protein